jgi:PAS domain S-box-containing protein
MPGGLLGFYRLLGYLFGTPLLYGGDIIPMAAATSLAFLFLGAGVALAAGPDFYPLNLAFGRSPRNRLTRIFIPLVLLLILAQALVYEIFTKVPPLPPPLVSALSVLTFIIITIVAVERASTSIGEVLTQVMDNQEEEITKRTLDLLIITNKLQTLLQASPLAIISLDLEGRVRSWNPTAENLFGWTEAEVLGKPLPTVPEEEQEEFQHSLRQIKKGESGLRAEIRRRRKDGAIIQVSLSTAPVSDAAGQITGVMGILEDITLLKQAQEALRQSQEQMHQLLESTEQGIYGIDPEGGCTFINRAALEMLQYSRAEVMGKCLHQLIHHTHADGTPYPKAECPVNQVLRSGMGAQLDDEVL